MVRAYVAAMSQLRMSRSWAQFSTHAMILVSMGACSAADSAKDSAGLSGDVPGSSNSPFPAASSATNAGNQGGAPNTDATSTSPPIVDGDGNEVEAVPDLEDEEEVLVQFELPSAGERYVYAANPENNSVAVVDSTTLGIQSVEAGDRPTFLQTLAGTDAAIVLNVNSNDATIIRTVGGVSSTSDVDVVSGSNAIAVAPNGSFAVVYFNVDLRSTGASGSFQDLSVVLLEDGNDRAIGMTVGFRPRAVHFSDDSTKAFVVTEDGVSVLDVDQIKEQGSHIARTVALSSATESSSLDVSITPDGRYAVARQNGEGTLRLAALDDEDSELKTLDLTEIFRRAQAAYDAEQAAEEALPTPDAAVDVDAGALVPEPDEAVFTLGDAGDAGDGGDGGDPFDARQPTSPATTTTSSQTPSTSAPAATTTTPETTSDELQFTEITDVDLSPTGDFALAVFRDRRTVLKVPVPEAFDDMDAVSIITVGDEIVGSVNIAPDGKRALLYTTAQDTNEHISVLDVERDEIRVIRLPKSVQAVTIAPDSESALVAHRKLPGDSRGADLTPDQLIDQSYGYSVLELDSGFSKLQLTDAPLGSSTIVPDGSTMFILFNSPAQNIREVHRVGLRDFLVRPIVLGSPPVSVGTLPGVSKVFVGQEHPDGRMTFIDWETAETESVTGFELNSRIRE
jgi:hypothetical protein